MHMLNNEKAPMRLISAATLALVLAIGSGAEAQVKTGLQPGLTRGPDSARKISLADAIRQAQQNSPQAIQAEGNERTSKAVPSAITAHCWKK